MLKLFITVDTEVWPRSPGWPKVPLGREQRCEREIAAYFHGDGGAGSARGVPWQLETLASAGLKATYFVEPLFSYALGLAPLRTLVSTIRGQGQEIGLHLHPEWLTDPRCTGLPAFAGPLLHAYSEADQSALIAAGLARLREAGADDVAVFRAGSWGANTATLRALEQNGIACDSSLNAQFGASFPDVDPRVRASTTQPVRMGGVWEFPVTRFVDHPPAGFRPLHVCAASLGEFRSALEHAARERWYAAVIVLHSFEFVRVDRLDNGGAKVPHRLLADRFERLCAYLARHADRYETCHFADLDLATMPTAFQPHAAVSSRGRTAMRQLQQLASRFY